MSVSVSVYLSICVSVYDFYFLVGSDMSAAVKCADLSECCLGEDKDEEDAWSVKHYKLSYIYYMWHMLGLVV